MRLQRGSAVSVAVLRYRSVLLQLQRLHPDNSKKEKKQKFDETVEIFDMLFEYIGVMQVLFINVYLCNNSIYITLDALFN